MEELHQQVDSPASPAAAITARQAAARKRAGRERQERLEQAIAQLPELKRRQEEAARQAGQGKSGQKIREKEPRVSTTDAEARVMKMPKGGFNPAQNVQLAADAESRAIVGVEVSPEGSDAAGLSAPMREQVEKRTGRKVQEHLAPPTAQGSSGGVGGRFSYSARTSGWVPDQKHREKFPRGLRSFAY